MKILHLTNYFNENYGYQENHLLNKQSASPSNNVQLITTFYEIPSDKSNFNTVRNIPPINQLSDNLKIIRKKSIMFFDKPSFIFFFIFFDFLKFRPDVVHIHNATNLWSFQIYLLRIFFKFKIFIDCHQDELVEKYSGGFFSSSFYFLWGIFFSFLSLFKFVDKFLPITKSSSLWLQHRLNIPISLIHILPLGCDINKKNNLPDSLQAIRFDSFTIVYSGKMYPDKKIDYLLDLFIALRKLNNNFFLVLIGNGSNDFELQLSRKLSLLPPNSYKRYPFLPRDELYYLYSRCHLGVWPGIPSISIQESISCGLPIAIPDNNIVGHLLHNNGFYLNFDVSFDSQNIFSLFKDFQLWSFYSNNSTSLSTTLSWDTINNQLEKLYQYE